MGTCSRHWAAGLEVGGTCKSTLKPVVKLLEVKVKEVIRN